MSDRSDAPVGDKGLADFLAGLAHGLRTPLGIVNEALREVRSGTASADEQRVLVGLAERGLARLERIANTVSLAAALTAGGLSVRRGSGELNDILRAAIEAAGAVERRREVQVTSDLPQGSCVVEGDIERLITAFSEIVNNAIRHTKGKVRVVAQHAPGEPVVVTVEDDGQGVPEERRATLFQRFLPRATHSGLGLGLSVAHDIFVAHKGSITLEPSTLPPGRPGTVGARFVITLPIQAGAS